MQHYNKFMAVAWFTEMVTSVGNDEKAERYDRATTMLKQCGWEVRYAPMVKGRTPRQVEGDMFAQQPYNCGLCQEN